MSSIPSRYRVVNFIGGRILEARELLQLQDISHGIDVLGNGTSTSYVEEEVSYRQGAMLNGTIVVSGSSATIQPTDGVNPIMVFVRDRWESFQSTELNPVTLSGGQTALYLNWQIIIITSTDDPTLVDGATGQPTAEMGQLSLQVSATDTSAASLTAGVQLYKNTSPIVLCNFTYANGVYTVVPLDNVNPNSLANNVTSGFVKLTTGTAAGIAVSTNDPRMTNTRSPSTASVIDASVRTPVSPGGANADGTTTYNLTSDPGGISAAKVVLTATTQLLSDAWNLLQSNFNSLLSRYNAHQGVILGLSNTHPIPTPAQVGAAPLSHVGLPLNLPTSHTATVNQGSSGFILNRGTGTPIGGDAGYGIFSGSGLVAGLMHNGDVYSSWAAQNVSASPGGIGVTFAGPLGYYSALSTVVAQHVNQTSNANPHGLTLANLGGQPALGFTPVQQGTGIGQFPNTVKIGWDGSYVRITIDATDMGGVVFQNQFNSTLANYATNATVNNDIAAVNGSINTINTDLNTLNPLKALQQNSPGKQYNTIYQNQTGYPMTVAVSGSTGSGGGAMTAVTGPTYPPTIPVVTQSRVPAASSNPVEQVGITFMVPQGWYYEVEVFQLGLNSWVEWSY